jgi:cytochrome c553
MIKKSLGFLLLSLPLLVNAADIDAGKAKSAVCAACHGADGISAAPIYPNLHGQKEAYLVSSLKAYKANQRQGGMAVIMAGQAAALSDDDIANLAAYYSSLK